MSSFVIIFKSFYLQRADMEIGIFISLSEAAVRKKIKGLFLTRLEDEALGEF